MSKEVSEAESRVNTKVFDAQSAMQKTEDAMNTAVEQMNKRLDANVTASTDAKADYAAELVDVRVGQDGTVYPSAGEAIRGQYSLAVENGITGAKLALAGSNGNLGEVFPKAAMPALLGAKCEAGEFLDYRITGNYGLRSVLPSLYQYADGQIPKISVHLQDPGDFRLLCRCELLPV